MSTFSGLRVLVTGGSRGIGAACCRALAAEGASVLIHYRSGERAAAEILERLPAAAPGHRLCGADLEDPDAVAALFDFVAAEWGGLDCLVNNAGVWRPHPLEALDLGRLAEEWRVNLRAPFLCAARALPLLRQSNRASIVNVSSTAGQRGEAGYSPYAAAKGALLAATRSWAVELAPGIRVNSVAPGWTETDMIAPAVGDGGRERIVAGIPLGRIAEPEDIAAVVVFLVSAGARHLTGATLSVNGGGVLSS